MLGLFLLIAIGLVAGGVASSFTHGGRLGTTGNLVAGIAGSLTGGLLFQQYGASMFGMSETPALLLSFAVALVVAVVVLIVAHLIKR
jgi:uncharacterized membrane protein YeaQ/YmgE (transglycosylase-associated protein family)